MTTTLTGREYWNFPKLLDLNIVLPEERGKGGGGARAMCSLCAGIFERSTPAVEALRKLEYMITLTLIVEGC